MNPIALTARPLTATLALSAILLATACEQRTATTHGTGAAALSVVISRDSSAPAPAVAGAKRGGTVTVLLEDDFEHLDPGRAYVNTAQLANQVLQRTLTTYRRTSSGKTELVGDLATDTGRTRDGGRTWAFTLRKGLAYEDGSPITSADVAYGIARSFSPALSGGPAWLQQWLSGSPDFAKTYRGPYDGGALLPPGVQTPDARTIVFHFASPEPDLPFVAALGTTTPVPRSKDTKTNYDNHPVASGPYRIQTYHRGDQLVLVRNPHWDENSDPARHAYPDGYVIKLGQTAVNSSRRLLDESADDASALTWNTVPPETLPLVKADKAVEQRATAGATAYVGFLKINTRRVTDLTVRRALNCAFDRIGYIKVIGGLSVARPSTTMLPQFVAGYRNYQAYGCGVTGDPARAKKMLGGHTVELKYGFRNNTKGQKQLAFMQATLGKAGFDIKAVPLDSSEYYDAIGRKDNNLDIYMASASPDWPTGAAMLPPMLDGRAITDGGNTNNSYLNDTRVNAEIDRIWKMTDHAASAAAWADLDEKVMREHAPLVPVYYDRTLSLNGSRVGGLYLDVLLGGTSLLNAYLR